MSDSISGKKKTALTFGVLELILKAMAQTMPVKQGNKEDKRRDGERTQKMIG